MSTATPAPEDPNAVFGRCVALLRAGQCGDIETLRQAIEDEQDPIAVISCLAGITNRLGMLTHGAERFNELVASWRRGEGIPGVHQPPWPRSPFPTSDPSTRVSPTVAAVGIISAVLHSLNAAPADRAANSAGMVQLLPDLFEGGSTTAALAMAGLVAEVLQVASNASGTPAAELWQTIAQRVVTSEAKGVGSHG